MKKRQRRRMVRLLFVLAVLLGSGVAAACGGSAPDGERAATRPPVSQIYYFNTFAEMIATSDAVVEATVTEVKLGRIVGLQPGEEYTEDSGAIQFQEATLRVDRILYGALEGNSIALEEDGSLTSYSEVGDHGVYVLRLKREPTEKPYYRVINSQGRFLEADSREGERPLIASDRAADWVKELENGTLAELRGEVAEASNAIEQGKVKGLDPPNA